MCPPTIWILLCDVTRNDGDAGLQKGQKTRAGKQNIPAARCLIDVLTGENLSKRQPKSSAEGTRPDSDSPDLAQLEARYPLHVA